MILVIDCVVPILCFLLGLYVELSKIIIVNVETAIKNKLWGKINDIVTLEICEEKSTKLNIKEILN